MVGGKRYEVHESDYYPETRANGATREARLLLPPFAASCLDEDR